MYNDFGLKYDIKQNLNFLPLKSNDVMSTPVNTNCKFFITKLRLVSKSHQRPLFYSIIH